jgi:hypothetical protein
MAIAVASVTFDQAFDATRHSSIIQAKFVKAETLTKGNRSLSFLCLVRFFVFFDSASVFVDFPLVFRIKVSFQFQL